MHVIRTSGSKDKKTLLTSFGSDKKKPFKARNQHCELSVAILSSLPLQQQISAVE